MTYTCGNSKLSTDTTSHRAGWPANTEADRATYKTWYNLGGTDLSTN